MYKVMSTKKQREEIIKAGEIAVKELIKVARESIISGDPESDVSADRLKNAAATKKLAIFDAFDILNRIDEERNLLNDTPSPVRDTSKNGFAERFGR